MTPSRPHPTGSAAPLAAADATAFVQAQATMLARGLRAARSPEAVGGVLDEHDASHGAWLGFISWAGRADAAVRDLLADLYVQHGRTVGALERAASPLLPPEVREQVLAVHARHLAALTAAAQLALAGLEDVEGAAC